MKTGILMHVYHLTSPNWERLVWGDPGADRLGSLPMAVYLLLTAPADAPVDLITIGCGPSVKNGMDEAHYTKQFLLDRFAELSQFPRLKPLLLGLDSAALHELHRKLEAIVCMQPIVRTQDELTHAAILFEKAGITRVLQLAAASHAPRCAQLQATARFEGRIPSSQMWLLAMSDSTFDSASPDDTVVLEPPHRGDDPMLHVQPTLAQAIKPVLYASPEVKIALIKVVKDFLERSGR